MTDHKALIERLESQAKGDAWHCTALAVAAIKQLVRERDEARREVEHFARKWEATKLREDEALEALRWYGEQARLARLIHSEGDAGRHALDADGGTRARTIIAKHRE